MGTLKPTGIILKEEEIIQYYCIDEDENPYIIPAEKMKFLIQYGYWGSNGIVCYYSVILEDSLENINLSLKQYKLEDIANDNNYVVSTNLLTISWRNDNILTIHFKNNYIYNYQNVPYILYEELMENISQGKFFCAHIRPDKKKYPFDRVA